MKKPRVPKRDVPSMLPVVRCVRIGNNTINLHTFNFARIVKSKGENSEGKLKDVYLLTFHFNERQRLELQFDTLPEAEAARGFAETAAGGVFVMPDIQQDEEDTDDDTGTVQDG